MTLVNNYMIRLLRKSDAKDEGIATDFNPKADCLRRMYACIWDWPDNQLGDPELYPMSDVSCWGQTVDLDQCLLLELLA